MALGDADTRPLIAVGLVDRFIAGDHGHPVVEQRARFEVSDFHIAPNYADGRRASTIFIKWLAITIISVASIPLS